MEVRFTKETGRRYTVGVTRERGVALAPRTGPGYDEHLPHDAVHLIVEREARLPHGVFGQLADGRNGLFWPADPAERRRAHRREARRHATPQERADMARSEWLASVAVPLWALRTGRLRRLPEWMRDEDVCSPLLDRVVVSLNDFATRWRELPTGASVTLPWP